MGGARQSGSGGGLAPQASPPSTEEVSLPAGAICYLEIPTTDVERSAEFYTRIFGWSIRVRGDGARAFDDTTGAVSGTWIAGRPAGRDAGVLTYIMVENVEKSLAAIAESGGEVVTPRTSLGPGGQAYGTFRDPAGNLFGVYQD